MLRIRELDPVASISRLEQVITYEQLQDKGRILEGLSLAGLPE